MNPNKIPFFFVQDIFVGVWRLLISYSNSSAISDYMEASRPVRWFCFSVAMNMLFSNFIARKLSCGKVMILHVSVILSSGVWCHFLSGLMFLLGEVCPRGARGIVPEGGVQYTLPNSTDI